MVGAAFIVGGAKPAAAADVPQTANCTDKGGTVWNAKTLWGKEYTAGGVKKIANDMIGFTTATPAATTVDYTVMTYDGDGKLLQTLGSQDRAFDFKQGTAYLTHNPINAPTAPGRTKILINLGDGNDGAGNCTITFTQEAPALPADIDKAGPNITSVTPEYIGELQSIKNTSGWQAMEKDETTGEMYMSQALLGVGKGNEHAVINHFTKDGKFIDTMIAYNAGHPTTLGVEHTAEGVFIWIPWETRDANGKRTKAEVARIKYSPGTKKNNSTDVRMVNIFTTRYSNPSLDVSAGLLSVRSVDKYGDEWYTRRTVVDVLMGIDRPLGVVGPLPSKTEVSQGHAVSGSTMYKITGATNGTILLRQYSFITGTQVGAPRDITALVGLKPGEVLKGNAYKEPEGLMVDERGLIAGIKMYGGERKTFRQFLVGIW